MIEHVASTFSTDIAKKFNKNLGLAPAYAHPNKKPRTESHGNDYVLEDITGATQKLGFEKKTIQIAKPK